MEALQGAAVKYLLGIPEVVAAVGETAAGEPYIFRDETVVNLESGHYTAVTAINIDDAGPITSLELSRYRGRRLRLTIWANGDRALNGILPGPKSVHDAIATTFAVVDKYLHRVDPEIVMWGSYATVSCDRLLDLTEPVLVSEGDGIMIASAYYGVFF
jgi:hypothetical protein